jgi:hypothetical protein
VFGVHRSPLDGRGDFEAVAFASRYGLRVGGTATGRRVESINFKNLRCRQRHRTKRLAVVRLVSDTDHALEILGWELRARAVSYRLCLGLAKNEDLLGTLFEFLLPSTKPILATTGQSLAIMFPGRIRKSPGGECHFRRMSEPIQIRLSLTKSVLTICFNYASLLWI